MQTCLSSMQIIFTMPLFRVLVVLLELLDLLEFLDSLVCLALEEIVVPLVVLVLWYVRMKSTKGFMVNVTLLCPLTVLSVQNRH